MAPVSGKQTEATRLALLRLPLWFSLGPPYESRSLTAGPDRLELLWIGVLARFDLERFQP